jgi:putative membrane protein
MGSLKEPLSPRTPKKEKPMRFLIQILISSLAILVTAYLLPGVEIQNDSIFTAILVAAVLAFFNAVVKPILIFLTIPITFLTFGLFLLVINAVIILWAGKLVSGFQVNGFWWALLFSLVLSLVTGIFEAIKRRDDFRNP